MATMKGLKLSQYRNHAQSRKVNSNLYGEKEFTGLHNVVHIVLQINPFKCIF